MFCSRCGANYPDNAPNCPSCGTPNANFSALNNQGFKTRGYGSAPPVGDYGNVPPGNGYGNVPPGSGYGNIPPGGGYGNIPPNMGYGGYGMPSTPPPRGNIRLATDRSLLIYILLTFCTCGIYAWIFFYNWANDVNTVCAGDGDETPGLLTFVLLTICTCGIYAWIWYYSLGNRLANNAPRYGMTMTENGDTVLLWMLFGALICGIGPLVGLHILISNTNRLCDAYNRYNGLM